MMKVAKNSISALCKKKRPRGKDGEIRDEAGVWIRAHGVESWRKCGLWGSKEAEKNYKVLCAQFYAEEVFEADAPEVYPLTYLFNKFLDRQQGRGTRKDYEHFKTVIGLVVEVFPDLPLSKLNAVAFRTMRAHIAQYGEKSFDQAWTDSKGRKMKRRKCTWSRTYVNKLINLLRQIFRWGFSYDLISAEFIEKIKVIPGIERGEYELLEREKRQAVPDDVVIRTLPFLYPTAADMVKIIRGACMRPCELCALRVRDLDRSGSLYRTRTRHHKTERFGIERYAAFGRAETEILRRHCEGKMGRDAMAADFEVGIQFSRRLGSMSEIPQNVEFLEALLKHLGRLSSFTGIDGCRGADVLNMTCNSLYANQEMEGTRVFDALIVLTLKIYFTKGLSHG